jgi:ribosome-associated protein
MEDGILADLIRAVASQQFARSSGPGGQNVNKVNTKVLLRIPLGKLGLSESQLARLRSKLGKRITGDDELIIESSGSRSQEANRKEAIGRAARIISAAIVPPRPRHPTRPTKASRQRRLEKKRASSRKKQLRRPPAEE